MASEPSPPKEVRCHSTTSALALMDTGSVTEDYGNPVFNFAE